MSVYKLHEEIVQGLNVLVESNNDIPKNIQSAKTLLTKIRREIGEVTERSIVNPLLRGSDAKIFAPNGLKDTEVRALALYSIANRDSVSAWKIREFLEENYARQNPQFALLLNCRSLSEAVYRLGNLNSKFLTQMSRNLGDNTNAGLRKLRVHVQGEGPVNKPQRKRGYNDKGSMSPDSAWKNARAFWQDNEVQQKIDLERRARKDAELLLQGFTD